jgi:hypothetical protein
VIATRDAEIAQLKMQLQSAASAATTSSLSVKHERSVDSAVVLESSNKRHKHTENKQGKNVIECLSHHAEVCNWQQSCICSVCIHASVWHIIHWHLAVLLRFILIGDNLPSDDRSTKRAHAHVKCEQDQCADTTAAASVNASLLESPILLRIPIEMPKLLLVNSTAGT